LKDAIPKDVALQLCNEIREENARKKFSFGKMFCHFCKGSCVFANEQNRGCWRVNKRYDKLHRSETTSKV